MAITYVKDIPDFTKKVEDVTNINELELTVNQLSASMLEVQGDITTLAGAMTTANEEIDDIWKSNNVLGSKNLIPYPYYEATETDRGITYTNNADGTVTVSAGTPEPGTNHTLVSHLSHYQPLKNAPYILSCGYTGSEAYLRLQLFSNGSLVTGFQTSNGVVTVDTTEYTFDAIQIQILVVSQLSTDITITPMLRPASYQDSSYVQYAMTNKDLTDIVKCNQTTNGTYTLKATVTSGVVTYAWSADT